MITCVWCNCTALIPSYGISTFILYASPVGLLWRDISRYLVINVFHNRHLIWKNRFSNNQGHSMINLYPHSHLSVLSLPMLKPYNLNHTKIPIKISCKIAPDLLGKCWSISTMSRVAFWTCWMHSGVRRPKSHGAATWKPDLMTSMIVSGHNQCWSVSCIASHQKSIRQNLLPEGLPHYYNIHWTSKMLHTILHEVCRLVTSHWTPLLFSHVVASLVAVPLSLVPSFTDTIFPPNFHMPSCRL